MDHLALPTTPGPWPGVVVIHEAFGLDDNLRAHADHLAELGYLALAVDLFEGKKARRCLVSAFRQIAAGSGPMLDIIDAGRRGLAARDDCTGSVGVMGFCMGGAFALIAAPTGFDAASVNYGRLPKDLDATLAGACPIVASYGGADKSLRQAAPKLEAALTRLDIPHDVKEYPGATHAFMNERPAPWFLQKLIGITHDPAASADTWDRVDHFFTEHLAIPTATDAPTEAPAAT